MPQLNPDGTVQVAAPTQSAFAQPLGQAFTGGAPAPAAMPPSTGTPGFSGALLDAIKAIAQHLAPKAVTDIKARTNQAIDDKS